MAILRRPGLDGHGAPQHHAEESPVPSDRIRDARSALTASMSVRMPLCDAVDRVH